MHERQRLPMHPLVIPPFLMGLSRSIHATVFSFIAGAIRPMAMLGPSLLFAYVFEPMAHMPSLQSDFLA
jgi:hypothetical protein